MPSRYHLSLKEPGVLGDMFYSTSVQVNIQDETGNLVISESKERLPTRNTFESIEFRSQFE